MFFGKGFMVDLDKVVGVVVEDDDGDDGDSDGELTVFLNDGNVMGVFLESESVESVYGEIMDRMKGKNLKEG